MKCQCRQCYMVYDEDKSRADYKGYCSQACLHTKAHSLGYRKPRDNYSRFTEYDVLNRANELGSVPVITNIPKPIVGSQEMTYDQLQDLLNGFTYNQLMAKVELNMEGTKVFPKATDFVYPVE